jgi:hypothetical protein
MRARVLLAGVHLHAQVVARVDELHEQRKAQHAVGPFARLLAHEGAAVFLHERAQRRAVVRAAVDDAAALHQIGGLPRFARLFSRRRRMAWPLFRGQGGQAGAPPDLVDVAGPHGE